MLLTAIAALPAIHSTILPLPIPTPVETAVESSAGVTLEVHVRDLRNSKGRILALLWNGSSGFPDEPGRAREQRVIPLRETSVSFNFDGLEPGNYAVSLVHDENDNGKLDTNILGIPTEGMGTSNNQRIRLGPPRYAQAKFSVGDENLSKTIRVKYM